MDRIDRIVKHEDFKEYIHKIELCEQDRKFCRHDMSHFLDVCRLAEIAWLESILRSQKEEGCQEIKEKEIVTKELLYAAGLLHDIGRWLEYDKGISHERASCNLARGILSDCGFKQWEIESITEAILHHREKERKEENSLSGFLYRADKKSRPCFACKVRKECNWPKEKKNWKVE